MNTQSSLATERAHVLLNCVPVNATAAEADASSTVARRHVAARSKRSGISANAFSMHVHGARTLCLDGLGGFGGRVWNEWNGRALPWGATMQDEKGTRQYSHEIRLSWHDDGLLFVVVHELLMIFCVCVCAHTAPAHSKQASRDPAS